MDEAQFQALLSLIRSMIDEIGPQRLPRAVHDQIRQEAREMLVTGPACLPALPH